MRVERSSGKIRYHDGRSLMLKQQYFDYEKIGYVSVVTVARHPVNPT